MDEPRIFRRAFQVIYGLLVVGFVVTVAFAGTYGAFFQPAVDADGLMSPDITATSAEGQMCARELGVVFAEIDEAGRDALARAHEADAQARWHDASNAMAERLRALRAACHLHKAEMKPIAVVAEDIERQQQGYDVALQGVSRVTTDARRRLVERYGAPRP